MSARPMRTLAVAAEIAPFFSDLPARMAASHLVIGRSGASTVAELAAIGRPSILVPLPHAIDQDQFANAGVLERAGGAIRIVQDAFTPQRLAAEIAALAAAPQRLAAMAAAARSIGRLDAADRLADLVLQVAGSGRKTVVSRRTLDLGRLHETAAQHRPGAFRRHRRYRHERHRRGAGEPRLFGAGLRSGRERQRQAAARKGREDRDRTRRRESVRRRGCRRLLGDQAR